MCKGEVPSTPDAMYSKWVMLVTQQTQTGSPNQPWILEAITNWPKDKNFKLSSSEEEKGTYAEENSYYQMKSDSLFTDGSCCITGTH